MPSLSYHLLSLESLVAFLSLLTRLQQKKQRLLLLLLHQQQHLLLKQRLRLKQK
jgi:hypothetical protein